MRIAGNRRPKPHSFDNGKEKSMNIICHAILFSLATVSLSSAQVPQMIHYQGRVGVGGTNFDGAGQFKFSLVDGGPTTFLTLWSNDGTGTDGAAPDNAVALGVHKGLYSVLLGDTNLSNMTAIPSGVFTNADVRLRVWFDDGSHGWQQLSPDQRVAAVGYAMVADTAQTVPDGSITSSKIAPGAIGSAQIGNAAIGAANIATGSITGDLLAPTATISNLNAAGQSGIPSGGIILSSNPADSNLILAGYVKLGELQPSVGNKWESRMNAPLAGRRYHPAFWTGSRMLVWGGYGSGDTYHKDGALYDPTSNSWTAMTTNGAPRGRGLFASVWTGTEMIVWGGGGGAVVSYLNDGGRYDPLSDTWAMLSTNGAPSARRSPTAIWTGDKMIVWGGDRDWIPLGDGGRYDPASDTWSTMSTNGAPSPRSIHTAVWTGTEMIIWGGYDGTSLNTGGRYNPTTDTWTMVSTNGAPSGRRLHTAVWTGSEMIIWGGDNAGAPRSDAARYNPATDTWSAVAAAGAPSNRTLHSAVWTGTNMIVWGGCTHSFLIGSDGTYFTNGASYSPASNSWAPLPDGDAPSGRELFSALWTGDHMIIFGGFNGSSYLNDTHAFDPATSLYLYLRP
jgi:N-acetylneuraminic acid mutarotase